MLDASTRQQGVPLWVFFGGMGTELQTDMTITAGSSAEAAEAALAILRRGIDTLKIKVGALSAEEDAERVRAVHRVAPSARLLVDANGGYTPREARSFLEELRRAKVALELFEQPVTREDWPELARSWAHSPVLLCADESARSAADVLRLVRDESADAINIKPMKSGIVESMAMWSIARAAGLTLMIGGMVESPLAMSFSAHFAAGTGGFSYVNLDTPMFMREHPFVGGFEQHGARLSVSRVSAGHGVTVGS